MGTPCSCSRHADRIQVATNDAVVAKSPSSTALSPGFECHVLRTYLQENKAYMNKKLCQLFQSAIDKPSEALTSVQLKLCPMKETDWVHFSMIITHAKEAKELVIWKTGLSPQGFEFVCSYLGILTQLSVLTLEDVGLARHRMPQFANSLKRLSSLTTLNLGVNDLTQDSVEQMVVAFPSLTALAQLTLDDNQIGDKGCEIVIKAIDSLVNITLVGLRFNRITSVGVVHLLAASAKRKSLHIFADGNDISASDLETLRQTNQS